MLLGGYEAHAIGLLVFWHAAGRPVLIPQDVGLFHSPDCFPPNVDFSFGSVAQASAMNSDRCSICMLGLVKSSENGEAHGSHMRSLHGKSIVYTHTHILSPSLCPPLMELGATAFYNH